MIYKEDFIPFVQCDLGISDYLDDSNIGSWGNESFLSKTKTENCRSAMICAVYVAALQQLSGINSIISYTSGWPERKRLERSNEEESGNWKPAGRVLHRAGQVIRGQRPRTRHVAGFSFFRLSLFIVQSNCLICDNRIKSKI